MTLALHVIINRLAFIQFELAGSLPSTRSRNRMLISEVRASSMKTHERFTLI